MTTNYETIVKRARAAARDILRAQKVSALLGYIRNVEAKIKSAKESIAADAKLLAVKEYDLRIATQFESPNLEALQSVVEEAQERHAEFKERREKEIGEYEEKIAEYRTKIENWNTGESKVDYTAMVTLADNLLAKRIGEDFVSGAYDNGTVEDVNFSNTEEEAS